MKPNRLFWKGKRVLLTGHSGFKGSWLSLILNEMGAEVVGLSLDPVTEPNLYSIIKVSQFVDENMGDICDRDHVSNVIKKSRADILIHMAAQPLVRESYNNPYDTYNVNLMGTVNVFEAARLCPNIKAILNVTTDKCYRNKEWIWPYREDDPLGGHDPYSASKSCSEMITHSYAKSFFVENNIGVASARAGNVIGGGDWSSDRLIPDFFRQMNSKKTLSVRSPGAVRPWQHVLEPLFGYLILIENLWQKPGDFSGPWNFGPGSENHQTVRYMVDKLCEICKQGAWEADKTSHVHEALILKLDINKAKTYLNWSPMWDINQSIYQTALWYLNYAEGKDMIDISLEQIKNYRGQIA